jgi:hypothetical protein
MSPSRTTAFLALLPLLAACGGDLDDRVVPRCAVTYAGAVSERVWCDTPALRATGGGGYVLWVMAFRGSGASADQAGQITLSFDARPVAGIDYGFTGSVEQGASGLAVRTVALDTTHEARSTGGLGAVTVRFTSLPPTDGLDPGGFDGIGPVHGQVEGTLVPAGAGGVVSLDATF